jgi:hypothetical protein
MFLDLLTTYLYDHVKTRIRIGIGLAPWIPIRICIRNEIKSRIPTLLPDLPIVNIYR